MMVNNSSIRPYSRKNTYIIIYIYISLGARGWQSLGVNSSIPIVFLVKGPVERPNSCVANYYADGMESVEPSRFPNVFLVEDEGGNWGNMW